MTYVRQRSWLVCTGRGHSVGHREELLNPCFPLDKCYAAVSGKHTKIDPEWPIAEVIIYESDYDDECQNRRNA